MISNGESDEAMIRKYNCFLEKDEDDPVINCIKKDLNLIPYDKRSSGRTLCGNSREHKKCITSEWKRKND